MPDGATKAIVSTQADIDAGFALYKEIEEPNELGLSPFVYRVNTDVIKPLLMDAGTDEEGNPRGVRRMELAKKYHSVNHKLISSAAVGAIVEQLESVGLVEEKPDPKDRRSKLVYGV